MNRPFLQTLQWLAFQQELGRPVWRLDDQFLSATVIRHDVRMGQNFLYIPYGPELNMDRTIEGIRNAVGAFARQVRGLARHERSMFVRIEPTHDMVVELLMRNGMRLKQTAHHIQPRRTSVVDLTLPIDTLTDRLHHKHRYNIGLAQRKGVAIEPSSDADVFWEMLQQTAEHDDFRTHDRLYYKKLLRFFTPTSDSGASELRAQLYLARVGGRPIAGAIMMEHGRTVSYLHGAMDREHRSLMAPHLLHWTLMQQYKQRGFSTYDLWGIDADKWPGVTRFKLGFGGRTIEYPGAFDVVLKPFWRWLYNWAPR